MDNGGIVSLKSFDYLRERIIAVRQIPREVTAKVAPIIQAKLIADSTTKRGNVPSYDKFGDVKTVANSTPNSIEVTAADWVMSKAASSGQIDEWCSILESATAEAVKSGAK